MWLCPLCNKTIIDFFFPASCFVSWPCACVKLRWFSFTEAFVLSHNVSSLWPHHRSPSGFSKPGMNFQESIQGQHSWSFLLLTGKTGAIKCEHIWENKRTAKGFNFTSQNHSGHVISCSRVCSAWDAFTNGKWVCIFFIMDYIVP